MVRLFIDPIAAATAPGGTVTSGAYVVAQDTRRVLQTRNLLEAVTTALSLADVTKASVTVTPATSGGLDLSVPFAKAGAPLVDCELLPADFAALYLPLPNTTDANRNGIADVIEQALHDTLKTLKGRGVLKSQDLERLIAAGIPAFAILRDELGLPPAVLHDVDSVTIDAKAAEDALTRGFTKRFGEPQPRDKDGNVIAPPMLERLGNAPAFFTTSEPLKDPTQTAGDPGSGEQRSGYFPDDPGDPASGENKATAGKKTKETRT